MALRVLKESPDDRDEVEALFDLAFAPGRTALSSYQLRDGVEPVSSLCLLARDDYNVVTGAIRYWPIEIGDEKTPAVLLGPVAVHPTRQGEGIGALLILESLEIAADLGWLRVVLIGDEPYYRRFGFRRALAEELRFPPPTNPNRILAVELGPDAMAGVKGDVRRALSDSA
ncbi:MAG: N-acetyltransferase [Pseudomonadota bacterium]